MATTMAMEMRERRGPFQVAQGAMSLVFKRLAEAGLTEWRLLEMAMRLARQSGLSVHDAEDNVQDLYLKLSRSGICEALLEMPVGAVYRYAQMAIVSWNADYYRRRQRHRVLKQSLAAGRASALPVDLDDEIDQRDLVELAFEMLPTEPTNYRTVFVMKYRDGKSPVEIAVALNTTVAAVNGILQRGKKLLRESMESVAAKMRQVQS